MEVDTPNNAAAFKVVVNHEEQYASWPDDKPVRQAGGRRARREHEASVSNGSAPTEPTGAH
ncbi:MbtH family NRPS accessory protein [Burkholderia ambifaria]|uniref:MbtH family NRPS accessory protein n=1 Tax=Burkholderia ambifaria TaxID=152480 RepID=UPI000AC27792